MTRTTVLFVPGTFEPVSQDGFPVGMLKRVSDQLPPDRFQCQQIRYPMSYGNPTAYEDSVGAGVKALLAGIRQTANPAVLIGYSQGAVVVSRVAAEIRDGKHPDLDVRMVVTVANPERAEGEGGVPGSGIAGGRSLAGCPFPVVQLALPDDAITSASRDSLWRTVSDLSAYMSGDVRRWAEKSLAALNRRQLQNLSRWENGLWMLGQTPRRVSTAAREINGYLGRPAIGPIPAVPSIHTLYGVRKFPGTNRSYLDFAAERIRSL